MLKTPDFYVFLHFSVPQDPPQGSKKFSEKKIFFPDFAKVKCDCENDPQNRGSSKFPFFPFFPFPLSHFSRCLVEKKFFGSKKKSENFSQISILRPPTGDENSIFLKKKIFFFSQTRPCLATFGYSIGLFRDVYMV